MFSMFALGNSLFACGVRSACERSFEKARGAVRRKLEDACWRRGHAHCRRWRRRRGHAPPVRRPKPNPNLNLGPPWALFCLKLDNARYSCGNNCNVVVKLVQEYHFVFLKIHFTSVLRKQFAANDTFLREANSYKRALALRNSRLYH